MRNQRCAQCRFGIPIYMGDGDELMTACVYILRTGHKRPCPAGDGCAVFEPARPGDGPRMEKILFGKEQYI